MAYLLFSFRERKHVMKFSARSMTATAMVAAIYAVLTIILGDLSYGGIQVRLSEALMLLCFFRKEYCYALTLGCFIANLFSPMPPDIIFGTLATAFSAFSMHLIGKGKKSTTKMLFASLLPVLFNAVIIGFELNAIMKLPLYLSMLQVAIGELISCTVIGCLLFLLVLRNKEFSKLMMLR